MELTRLSASKMKTFSSCPRKFYYEYVERQRQPKHIAALMGSAVHKTIETHYLDRREGIVKDPLLIYNERISEELNLNPDVEMDGRVIVDGSKIVAAYDFEKREPKVMEMEFFLPFPDALFPICEIHGFIDQMYDWGLVDLKTSKRKPASIMLENDLQFMLYQWAFQELTGEPAKHTLWHHLRTGEDLEVENKLDGKKLGMIERIIVRILEGYETETWDRCVGEACMFCSHKEICLGVV